MPPTLKVSPDDHALFFNGIPVQHWVEGGFRPTTAERVSDIETGDGIPGQNVPGAARSKPGQGAFTLKNISPQLFDMIRASSDGDSVAVMARVVKNFAAYPYSEIGLSSAIPAIGGDVGPGAEGARDVPVNFRGTGFFIKPRSQ